MPLHDQIAAALTKVRETCGDSITYSRGSQSLTVTEAVQSSTPFRITEVNGRSFVQRSTDWLVDVDALDILGLPEIGDRITATINGSSKTFEVVEFNGEPCYRFSDQGRTQLRIHCQEWGT